MNTATESQVQVTTMEQRMKALLCETDWTIQGKSIINDSVQELFHKGTPAEELRRIVLNDERWPLLNERQKAFILAEVDLVGCPVKVGDTIEILTDNASNAPVRRGQIAQVQGVSVGYVTITEGVWAIGNQYYRLVPSLEFPTPMEPFSTVTDVTVDSFRRRAQNRLESFVTHANDEGDWGTSPCECRIVMGGVDTATPHFVGWGIGRVWGSSTEGKRYIGEVVRWMRAMAVKKWMDQQPVTVVNSHEPEAPVGSPNPEPVDIEPISTTPPTMEELAAKLVEMTDRITRHDREMADVRAENVRLRQWQTSALRDFEIANEILNEQAVRREWCSEYEDVLERINGRTSVLQWEPRTRDVEVEVTGTVTRSFRVSVTVEVGPDDDAEQLAQESVESNYTTRSLFNDYYSDDPEIEIDECEVQ